jgi:sugar phosphate isomerase/epimerase
MKMAAQLYTLREYLKTPEQIEATFGKVKAIGYDAVQVSGLGPIDPKQWKQMTDRIGLTICATHIGYADLTERPDEVIETHRLWECKYVGLGSMPQEFRTGKEGYVRFAAKANEIGRRLSDAGLKFIYHNHNFEFAKFDGKTGMDILLEETDPEAVGFELDVYWAQAGGADPADWIRKLNGRMKVVHWKDMTVTSDREQRFAAVGEGNMNFRRILDACKEIGVEWGAVEQDQCYEQDAFDCLRTSYQNLRKLGIDAAVIRS